MARRLVELRRACLSSVRTDSVPGRRIGLYNLRPACWPCNMTNTVSTVQQISEYTKIGQNVILALCAIATVLIAFFGLKTWRKELKGKSEYIKAKEVLKAVYKVRTAFMHVRNPSVYSHEYPEEMRSEQGYLKGE